MSCIHKFLLQITKYCAALQKSNLYIVVLCKWWYFRHFYFARRYDIINVSSTTALKAVVARQSVLQTVVCFKNTLSRRFLLCARPCAPLETFCMTSCHKRLLKRTHFLMSSSFRPMCGQKCKENLYNPEFSLHFCNREKAS